MNSSEVLRCCQMLSDTEAPSARLLLPFLAPSASPANLRCALQLCESLRDRDEDVLVALLRILQCRNEPWAADVIFLSVSALARQFGGAGTAGPRLASLLQETGCVPRDARTANDVLYLAALFECGAAASLSVDVESVLSEALWSSELCNAALVLARSILQAGGEDVWAAVELLFRALGHSSPKVACVARALLWEAVAHSAVPSEEDCETLLSRLLGPQAASRSNEAAVTADLAGAVCVLLCSPQDKPRHELLLAVLQKEAQQTHQSRALLEVFVGSRLTVERAGSALLFAICSKPDPMLPLAVLLSPRPQCPPHIRRAALTLYGIVQRAEAVDELCLAILEHAEPADRAFVEAEDLARAMQMFFTPTRTN